MANTPIQLQAIDDVLSKQLGTFTSLPKITVPNTTIVNRAQCVDPANDHQVRFGVSRVMTQQIVEVQGESGPNGERVWKPINDSMDQVRFVGGGWVNNAQPTTGFAPYTLNTGDYVEITFYGTGLNLLTSLATTARSAHVTVDGGSEGVTSVVPAGSTILNTRNYPPNVVVNAASGLSLNTHTVKIRNTGDGSTDLWVLGYEVLNTNSTLQYVPGSSYTGGRKVTKTALSTDTYNSNFESGSLGTKGGHVVVYQKSDGTIKKAVQSTDVTALYMTNADHSNEAVIRDYSWREFGAGRTDDFSLLTPTSSGAKAFTLDDGTTTLVSSSPYGISSNSVDCFSVSTTNDYYTFTFVGTGLDILFSNPASRPLTISVDGTAVLTATAVSSTTGMYWAKIASGLPYGTHTVKVLSTSSSTPFTSNFLVYGPKKPSIPSGSVEIADYYVMANYSVSSSAALGFLASGVLRKFGARENVYTGTWTLSGTLDTTNFDGGLNIATVTSASTFSYTFFGTGFEYGSAAQTGAKSITFSVDGSSNLSGFTTAFLQTSSGLSFTASTGTIAGTSAALGRMRLQVSGLSLGLHTVKMTVNVGTSTDYADTLDIITPTHSPKSNVPGDLQNTLTVGSNSLGDSRLFPAQTVKTLANWAQAVGVTSGPTTTSASNVPMPEMAITVKTTGNPIEIAYTAELSASILGASIVTQLYIDGTAQANYKAVQAFVANYPLLMSDSIIVPVAAGVHTIYLAWAVGSSATLTAVLTNRNLKVREIT